MITIGVHTTGVRGAVEPLLIVDRHKMCLTFKINKADSVKVRENEWYYVALPGGGGKIYPELTGTYVTSDMKFICLCTSKIAHC